MAISCPDGLAHALSEQNLRLQQIVYEHKVDVIVTVGEFLVVFNRVVVFFRRYEKKLYSVNCTQHVLSC